jgi:hypothetical protein
MKKKEEKFSLKKDEGGFIDQDGYSFETPEQWLFSGIMGGCGCGSSEEIAKKAVELLDIFSTEHSMGSRDKVYDDEEYEVLAHWMDSLKITEHGTNICSSWLTEKGEQILNAIREVKK